MVIVGWRSSHPKPFLLSYLVILLILCSLSQRAQLLDSGTPQDLTFENNSSWKTVTKTRTSCSDSKKDNRDNFPSMLSIPHCNGTIHCTHFIVLWQRKNRIARSLQTFRFDWDLCIIMTRQDLCIMIRQDQIWLQQEKCLQSWAANSHKPKFYQRFCTVSI